ncbi:MAG TPA: hypothetical protein VGD50_08305 [Candidatus Baltobacteraceae bacterium]
MILDLPSFRRALVTMILIAAALSVTACSHPKANVRVFTAATVCAAPCPQGFSVHIDERDNYTFRAPFHGRAFSGHVAGLNSLAQRIVDEAVAAQLTSTALRAGEAGGAPPYGISLWAKFDNGQSSDFEIHPRDDRPALVRATLTQLLGVVYAGVEKQEMALQHSLLQYRALQQVVITQSPFFSCPGVQLVFRRGDPTLATFGWSRKTTLPASTFKRVVAILNQEDAASLWEDYPIAAHDSGSVQMTLVYSRFTYVVNAPDSSTWPDALRAILARVKELVVENGDGPSLRACVGT